MNMEILMEARYLAEFSDRRGWVRPEWPLGDRIIEEGWRGAPVGLVMERGTAPRLTHGNTRAAYLGVHAPYFEIPVRLQVRGAANPPL